tara:strand:- start:316 stop:939 length:624 start_codon:yes stop_codon:yes gene_type:complete
MVGFKKRSVRTGFGLDDTQKARTRAIFAAKGITKAGGGCYCSVVRSVMAETIYIPGDPGYFSSTIFITLQSLCMPEVGDGEDNPNHDHLSTETKMGVQGKETTGSYSSFKVINCKDLPECGPCGQYDPQNADVASVTVNYFNEGTEDPDMPEWAKEILSGGSKERVAQKIAEWQDTPEGLDGANGPYDSEGNMQCPSGDQPCGESPD